MLISVRHAFIFVSTPHTASEKVENALGAFAEISRIGSTERQCIAWSDMRVEYSFLFDLDDKKPTSFFKFGVIRDPADWVWSFMTRSHSGLAVKEAPAANGTIPSQIETWWRANKARLLRWDQSHMFANFNRQCGMDLLIPFESLTPGLNALFERLNLPQPPLAPLSVGEAIDEGAPDQLRALVEDFLSESVELYRNSVAIFRSAKAHVEPTVAVHALPIVIKAQLRDLEPSASNGGYNLSGVLLLAGSASSDYKLEVRGGTPPHTIRTGLPSPWLAKKFAGHPGSHAARFMIEGLALDDHGQATIEIAVGGITYNWIDIR